MEIQNNEKLQNPQPSQPCISPIATTFKAPDPKPLFELSKGDNIFAICALAGCIFASLFGIFSGFALGYMFASVIMTVLFIVYLAKDGMVTAFSVICGILTIAISTIFICTTNSSVRFFGVIVSLLLSLACFDGLANGKTKGNRKAVGVFYSAASSICNLDIAIKSLFYNGKSDKKAVGKVFIGLACALPVLIVIIPLLLSSDDAFRGMMDSIFEDTFSTIVKVIFGTMISIFVISYGFSIKADRVSKIKKGKFKGIENVYIISFLSAIVLCYLLYLFSQLAYFFSAFKGFLPEGDITYARYARKGFFEMCAIAVINLAIVFITWLLAKKRSGKVCRGIKAMLTFIAAFTLIIISTAISKMVLYINVYGMTVLRITTSAFMLFLSIVFISVILKIYIRKINFVKTALLTAGIIILILGTVNVNSLCAKYNYNSYISGKLNTIDVEALYNLGDEGIPYVIKLTKCDDEEVYARAEQCIKQAIMFDYYNGLQNESYFSAEDLEKYRIEKGFESFSLPKAAAYSALYDFVEENPGFCYLCQEYYTHPNLRYDW